MKKVILFAVSALFLAMATFAQAPQQLSYQAVIRNSANALVASSAVGMRLSILQGSSTGSAVYVETQSPTTNENGLVSLQIGSGTVVSGSVAAIDWRSGPYFLKTEADPAGGTSYSITGASQLLSVPYSLYAQYGGMLVKKLHTTDELDLHVTSITGPYVAGSSTDIGNITDYNGLLLEWRMDTRAEVFQQVIYLSDYDKSIILGTIAPPANYPRRYTTILSDNFGTIMWLGVSMTGTRLYLSTNSSPSPTPRLQRIFAIY